MTSIAFVRAAAASTTSCQRAAFAVAASVLLLGCAGSPAPAGKTIEIAFDGKVPFTFENTIKLEVREQCGLNNNLANAIKQKAQSRGIQLRNSHEIGSAENTKKLTVEILSATPGIAVFGNLGSVPAELSIKFQVTEGDKVVREKFKDCSTNLAGFMGLQPTACNKLNKCAESMAEFVVRNLEGLR